MARSSFRMTARIQSARLPSPAISSMRPASSAGRRSAMTMVGTLRLSGGRPIRRVVADSVASVNPFSNSVAAYLTRIA